ncbi:hypothetical protein HDR58_10945 [bacterium]|nr:hypothetical protein [bacterium]
MKVPAINPNILNGYRGISAGKTSGKNDLDAYSYKQVNDLAGIPYVYPIVFTGIQNSSKLRILFGYNLPCMYSGIPMIDPKILSKITKSNLFEYSSAEVLKFLDQYKESFVGMEARAIAVLKERAKVHPDQTIKQLLQEIEPHYRRNLRKQQAPVFHRLTEAALDLPEEYLKKFNVLMSETNKKLNERPVIIPFSSYEFKYKLSKIAEDISNGESVRKSNRVMQKLMKEATRFAGTTSEKTIEHQKNVLKFLDVILKKSVLRDNPQLKDLIETSKARLLKEHIIVPFSRKSFIYDLARSLDDLPDTKLKDKLLTIAQELPTSQESLSAYILKINSEPSDKIGHRLIWPSLASVEHIFPKSEGGADILANFGGATTRENSKRKSIEFVEQLELMPQTRVNCQKYLDKLIELYDEGVFAKYNIDPKYITDFADTIYAQSKQTLKLDTSKFQMA